MTQASRPQTTWPPVQGQNYSDAESFMPAAKRQRLSPNPGSPYATSSNLPYSTSPNLANFALPNGAFNNSRPNGSAPQSFVSTSGLNTGMMGPPQRPAEKPVDKDKAVDINELNDFVTSSGINLRDEEEFLNAEYRTGRGGHGGNSQSSFDLLSQNNFGNLGAGRSSFGGPQSELSEEEEFNEKSKNAARQLAANNQHPLQNPFFWGASIRKHMQVSATEHGLQIPITGLWDRIVDAPTTMSGSSMKDANGYGVQVTRAPSMLTRGSALDPMISLMCLAGNDRIRNLLEDAYGVARGRQVGSDGVVPPEWADVATGEKAEQTLVTPQSISGTNWDAPTGVTAAQNESPLKRKKPENVPTTSFSQSHLNVALMALAAKDRAEEEERLKLRESRKKKKAQQVALAMTASMDSAVAGTSTIPTSKKLPPGMLGEKAPEAKLNKKERDKAAKADMSEEVAAREANATASMAIGGKQYSWLTAAKKPGMLHKPAFVKPGASVAASPKPSKDGLEGITDRKFGGWREDGVGAKGVQLRDVINVLELDGKEKKTLLNAYLKLDGKLVPVPLPTTTPAATAPSTPAVYQSPAPSQYHSQSQQQTQTHLQAQAPPRPQYQGQGQVPVQNQAQQSQAYQNQAQQSQTQR